MDLLKFAIIMSAETHKDEILSIEQLTDYLAVTDRTIDRLAAAEAELVIPMPSLRPSATGAMQALFGDPMCGSAGIADDFHLDHPDIVFRSVTCSTADRVSIHPRRSGTAIAAKIRSIQEIIRPWNE